MKNSVFQVRRVEIVIPWLELIGVLLVGGVILLAVTWFAARLRVPIGTLTQDPVSVLHAPFYTGLLSNLGILFWCAAATICLYGGFLVKRVQAAREAVMFLCSAGALSVFLVIDDLFLLHERSLEDLMPKGDVIFYGAYLIFLIWFLLRFRRMLLQTRFVLLAFALGAFAFSIAWDVMPDTWVFWGGVPPLLVEDGFKFVGILFWFVYFMETTTAMVLNAVGMETHSI